MGDEFSKVGIGVRRKSDFDDEDRDRHRDDADVHPALRTNVDGHTEYPAVVARIKTWAENKAAMMNGPFPMEIGEVQWEEYNDEWEDAEVQAVGPNT